MDERTDEGGSRREGRGSREGHRSVKNAEEVRVELSHLLDGNFECGTKLAKLCSFLVCSLAHANTL